MSYRFIENRLHMNDIECGVLQSYSTNINASWRQCMEGGLSNEFYALPTANVDCDISATATDASQNILVIGWDISGNMLQEVKTLNGQARVQLSNQYYRIKAMITTANTQTTEPFMDNNEDIAYVYDRSATLTTGKPDIFFGILDIGKSISKTGSLYLPAGRELALVSVIVIADSGAAKLLKMLVQFKNTNDNVWKVVAEATFQAGNSNFPLDCATKLYDADYGQDIRVSVQRADNTDIDSAMIALHYVTDDPQ